jgi:hypothetical protein
LKEFPKRVGIIFVEEISVDEETKKASKSKLLKFDQVACAHLILQMNKHQDLFDYQVVSLDNTDNFQCPAPKKSVDLTYFDNQLKNMIDSGQDKFQNIDYWICITSAHIKGGFFFQVLDKAGKSGKLVAVITSEFWERKFSPPSLFEYLSISVFICSVYFINYHYKGNLKPHKTKSCLFDYTDYTPQRRILVSNPLICNICYSNLQDLQNIVKTSTNESISLNAAVHVLLKRDWMGSTEIRDTPLYNLKKLYNYDVDRNSGFYKKWYQRIKESMIDNLAQWTVGTVVVGLIGILITLIFKP